MAMYLSPRICAGRFKSEGTFHLSSFVNLADPKATNETTDAYDTIEWLVKKRSEE